MDIELLRTFLAVTQVRHFGRAAENLFLTPAAVSARIRQLEQTLDVRLFHRTRGNIQMTTEGERLLPHARKLLAAWTAAQEDLALKPLISAQLKIGYPHGLWQPLATLIKHLAGRDEHPALSMQAQTSVDLLHSLVRQQLDLALLLEAPEHPDLTSIHFTTLSLALFNSTVDAQSSITYIHLDWGTALASRQRQTGLGSAQLLYANDPHLALAWMQKNPCRAFLPMSFSVYLPDNLQLDPEEPAHPLPLYLVYRRAAENNLLLQELLSQCQSQAPDGSPASELV